MSSEGDTLDTRDDGEGRGTEVELRPALIVLHAAEARLVGAALLFARRGEAKVIGRGERDPDDRHPRALPVFQRPGKNEPAGAFADPYLSREQLVVTATSSGVRVENVGKRDLLDARGNVVSAVELSPGDVCEVRGRLLFLATTRAAVMPAARSFGRPQHAFGEPDSHGLVGESPVAWKLRDSAAFVAARSAHLLLLGASGTGKEVVAQTVHDLSGKKGKKMVSRNAATLPTR